MSAQRILLLIAGLSFVPLLFSTDGLRADVISTNSASVTAAPLSTTTVGGRVSGEPITGPVAPEAPPEPSPLAPLAAPNAESTAPVGPAAADVVDTAARLEITAGATAGPAALPAAAPPDVIDDSRPITGSTFDTEDDVDRHPVESARSITGSIFDREDRIDEHPVP